MQKEGVLITGAGGFIEHHLVKYLKNKGYFILGVDIKRLEFKDTSANEFYCLTFGMQSG